MSEHKVLTPPDLRGTSGTGDAFSQDPEYDPGEVEAMAARQKELNAAMDSLLADPEWVGKAIEKDRVAYGLRTQLGELTGDLIEAQKAGDKDRVEEIRAHRKQILQELAEL